METSALIIEAKQGSAAAQKYLFDQLADKMMMVCRRYVKNSEDAENYCSMVFISSLKIYLLSITTAMLLCTAG